MAILLNDNLKIAAAKPVDNRFGPYASTAAALAAIPAYQRYAGLVVAVLESGDVVEYWFKSGTADLDLEVKTSGSVNGATGATGQNVEWVTINSNSVAVKDTWILADSSSGGFTITLPSSPTPGEYLWIQDSAGAWATNPVIVDPTTDLLGGDNESLSLDIANAIVLLTYVGGNIGWDIKNLAGDFNDTFIVGATGPAGSMGATGETGATGLAGTIGETGATGPQGDPGGATGATGLTGEPGPQGSQGPQGDPGPTGQTVELYNDAQNYNVIWKYTDEGTLEWRILYNYQGAIGPQGQEGPTGPQGQEGPTGPVGPSGAEGPSGAQGAQGTSFSLRVDNGEIQWQLTGDASWNSLITIAELTGPQGPSGPIGADGADNVSLRVADGHIQVSYDDSVSWSNLISLAELAGPQGPTGPQGEPGPQGSQGPQGDMGPTGESVSLQADGNWVQWKRDSDPTWTNLYDFSGAVGPSGDIGPSGAVGPSGDIGPTGEMGSTGATGEAGPTGDPGIADKYRTTSLTELTVGDGPLNDGVQTLTVETGLAYTPNQPVIIIDASSALNYMECTVVSYDILTGEMVVLVVSHYGTGAVASSWDVNLGGIEGPSGLSAYQIAQANGFIGNTSEWLGSIVGATGEIGSTGPSGVGFESGSLPNPVFESFDNTLNFNGSGSNPHTIYLKNYQIFYATVSSGTAYDITIDITGDATTSLNSLLSVGKSITFSVIASQDSSSGLSVIRAITVDGGNPGLSVNVRWANTSLSAGLYGTADVYSFSVLKTAENTFNIFASLTNMAQIV